MSSRFVAPLFFLIAATAHAQRPAEPAAPAEGQTQPDAAPQQPATPAPNASQAPAREGEPGQLPPSTQQELPPPPAAGEGQPPAEGAAPGSGATTGKDEISLDEWERNDWMLVQPKTALLELDGYLRLRADLFRKLNFGNNAPIEIDAATGEPQPRFPETATGLAAKDANFTGANMRLRVEPRINVTENIRIETTVDILDNVVLGSTPRFVLSSGQPLHVTAEGQEPPDDDDNALTDSIVVKRAWGTVTALSGQLELKFGRMPSNWGLGILSNSGDCLDCDFGDNVDRVALTFKAAEHLFTGMWDYVSNGPVVSRFGRSGGQPLDAFTEDDVFQYSLRVERLDAEKDIHDRVLQGKTVLNYGIWGIWRRQYQDLTSAFYQDRANPGVVDPSEDLSTLPLERRSADFYTGDGYLKLYAGEVELLAEAAIIYGKFLFPTLETSGGTSLVENTALQWGGAMEAIWRLTGEYKGTTLSLRSGIASADSAPGFGALDRSGTQRGAAGDTNLNNFQFSPDYHIDLLLYRNIIGTVTESWYVRPEAAYNFDNNIGGRLWLVYSQALSRKYAPGKSLPLPMALEIDGELTYGIQANPEGGAFKGAIAGGILFPFGAFKNPLLEADSGGSFAWTLQARLYLTF